MTPRWEATLVLITHPFPALLIGLLLAACALSTAPRPGASRPFRGLVVAAGVVAPVWLPVMAWVL